MKKTTGLVILILTATSLAAGVSAVAAMNFGGAPAEIATPVPTAAPTSGTHHHHHHLGIIGTPVVGMAAPTPIPHPTSTTSLP